MRILITVILLFPIFVNGQTAGKDVSPAHWKQDVSLDGKLDEWNKNDFIYNKETRLWYSLANDDTYLYLAVKKEENSNKIFSWGGLQFSVSKEDRKSSSSISFPLAIKNDKAVPHDQLTNIGVEGVSGIPEKH
ncbi:hypothetical protein [Sphingobacterium paucimobilis]|uniref:Carbohydrate-binding domain-containing protein n=1 Tax=Sphingobacterium paucimobilis HER1398 TaxID=1346330 RepID=U2J5D2_9SPHI|nr:hypothetical protein [Sphingobacterium paucimobilis]ERJ60134.1 hypothetical protein M472_15320 [Sphingobacterium paucimobilis HER1398]